MIDASIALLKCVIDYGLYGIQNIKRVIRKYNGTYLVKKEDVYKLMISFPLDVGNVKI